MVHASGGFALVSFPSGSFIDGRFTPVEHPDGLIRSVSPADTDDVLGEFPFARSAARQAVEAARRAQPAWAALSMDERARAIERLRGVFAARVDAMASALSREVGKPGWEALSEAALLAAKVKATLEGGARLVVPVLLPGRQAGWSYRPHGVLVVLGPFNFPAHLPNGHLVPALLLGNTVVVKPSEKTPAAGALYAELLAAADLPPGVVNVVQGGGEVGAWLAEQAPVDGVLFTGSLAIGRAIARANADRPGKLLALELGGKNAALVLADADLDLAAQLVAYGAYATAGQRCSSTSRVVVEQRVLPAFEEKLVEVASGLSVGHFARQDVFMGPLIGAAARDAFLAACEAGRREGATALLAPRVVSADRPGWYVSPGVHRVERRVPGSHYQRDELFGPDVAIWPAGSEQDAIAIANDTDFGLTAALFTGDRARFERLAPRLRAGVVNWNLPTVGANGLLPFGGVGDSGNGRPAGIFSTLYCGFPQALTWGEGAPSAAPGLPWPGASR